MTVAPTGSWVSQVQDAAQTMSGLGTSFSAAAQGGDFERVLEQANAAMDVLAQPFSASESSQAGSFVPTDALFSQSNGGPVTGSQVVSDAEQYLGVPYQWGGTSPTTGFDCSGFVQYVYGQLGVSLPRTSQQQATVGTPVVDIADAQAGDLVFYEPGPSGPGHVGIYIGNGEMIDAPHTGTSVQIEPVGQPSQIRQVLTQSSGLSADLQVPSQLAPIFEAASNQYGVPASLLAAVAKQESGFDVGAVSSAGAEGLMQLMPSTAAGLGVDPFDPAQAVDGAAQLLSGYLDQYGGSVPLALAAYNAGPGAVAQYGGIPPYAQTQNYVSDILASLGASG